jgi:hypothetical protein
VASRQLALFSDAYDQLVEQRDMAAYRALGAMTSAICFCRQNRTQDALEVLTAAMTRYTAVEEQLVNFKLKGENYAVQASL